MGWTKRQFVEQAFEEIGLAAYVYDLTPEQLQSALYRLDSMLATWNSKGIRIGWALPSSPQSSDLGMDTLVTDIASEAIYTNLATRIAPSFGKVLSVDTIRNANLSYNALIAHAMTQPVQLQYPGTLPSGSGNKPWRGNTPFVAPPTDPLLQGNDGEINFY